jgi:hypothetical protein
LNGVAIPAGHKRILTTWYRRAKTILVRIGNMRSIDNVAQRITGEIEVAEISNW